VIGVVAHPKLPPDDSRHPLGGPDFPTEAERFGPLRQQLRPFVPLLVRQFRWRAGRHPAPQRLDTAFAGTPHPLADGSRRHSERAGNRLLRPVLLLQCPGSQPPPFSPVAGRLLFCLHTQHCCTAQTSFSNRYGDQ